MRRKLLSEVTAEKPREDELELGAQVHVLATEAVDALGAQGVLDDLDRSQVYSLSVLGAHVVCARALGWDCEEILEDPSETLRDIEVLPSPLRASRVAVFPPHPLSPVPRRFRNTSAQESAERRGCTRSRHTP